MNAILKYPGGKWRIADWITSFFPDDEMAIEFASPFSLPSFCDLCDKTDGDNCVADKDFSCDIYYRKSLMKQWLESEAER